MPFNATLYNMRYIVAFLLSFVLPLAHADSWMPAKVRAVVSPDGNIVVRVLPGENLGEVYGFSGEKKGNSAQAAYYRLAGGDRYIKYQQVVLLNPIAPVDFFVSNSGDFATLDNWHNMGFGKAIVVYAPDGAIRSSYELKDIYTNAELKTFNKTTSSVWWRCNGSTALESRTASLDFNDAIGNLVEVDLKTGKLVKTATAHKGC